MEMPPIMVHAADQGFAAAQHRLDELIEALAEDIRHREDKNDATYWASSCARMVNLHAARGTPISPHLVQLWQAVIYRLARQKVDQEKVGTV